jgi:hypothetical protein
MKIRAWRPNPLDDVEACRVIKKAVGPDFALMYDRTAVRPGWVWDYPTALKVARGLEREGAYWLEEPFDGYDLQGPARLAAEVDIPITGGELGHSIHQFLGYLTYPANLCPLCGRMEFAGLCEDLGEPIGKAVEAVSRRAVRQGSAEHLDRMLSKE